MRFSARLLASAALVAALVGQPALAEQKPATSSGTPRDYSVIAIWNPVTQAWATFTGGSGGSGTEYVEDAAAPANPTAGALLCRRRDTLSTSEVSADLDWIAENCTNKGQLHVYAELVSGTQVGLTGSLPAFASPPTVNLGTLGGGSTAAKQPALGTAGTPSSDVLTVQGSGSGTPIPTSATQLGEVQATPTAYTLADRLKTLDTDVLALKALVGTASDSYDGTNGKTVLGYGKASADVARDPTAVATKPQAQTTGGCTPYGYQSAASNNSTMISTGAHTLCSLQAINTTATLEYLRVYDLAAAPTCTSATGFKFSVPIPASTTGAGAVLDLGPFGLDFPTGLGFCLTGGGGSTDNTSAVTGVFLIGGYK